MKTRAFLCLLPLLFFCIQSWPEPTRGQRGQNPVTLATGVETTACRCRTFLHGMYHLTPSGSLRLRGGARERRPAVEVIHANDESHHRSTEDGVLQSDRSQTPRRRGRPSESGASSPPGSAQPSAPPSPPRRGRPPSPRHATSQSLSMPLPQGSAHSSKSVLRHGRPPKAAGSNSTRASASPPVESEMEENMSDLTGLVSTNDAGGSGGGIWGDCYLVAKARLEREQDSPKLTRQEFLNRQVALSAETGNCSALEFWLARGASVNGQDAQGYAPLHWAACNGDAEVVRQLLDAGARPRTRTKQGRTALEMAEFYGEADNGSLEPKFVEIVEMIRGAVASEPYEKLTAEDMADMEEEERVRSLTSVMQDCRARTEQQVLDENSRLPPAEQLPLLSQMRESELPIFKTPRRTRRRPTHRGPMPPESAA